MSFKFYTKSESPHHLYCRDDNNRLYWFIVPWEEHAHWIQIDEIDFDLIEITEEQAQEICNNRVYATEVWISKKKKGVKIHTSLFDLPDPENKKVILFGFIFATIIFIGIFFMFFADKNPKDFLYFLGGSFVYVFLSMAIEKKLGLSDGEGYFIVLILGFLLHAFFVIK